MEYKTIIRPRGQHKFFGMHNSDAYQNYPQLRNWSYGILLDAMRKHGGTCRVEIPYTWHQSSIENYIEFSIEDVDGTTEYLIDTKTHEDKWVNVVVVVGDADYHLTAERAQQFITDILVSDLRDALLYYFSEQEDPERDWKLADKFLSGAVILELSDFEKAQLLIKEEGLRPEKRAIVATRY